MGTFRNDPPPFIGGKQPLEGRKMSPSLMGAAVDNPPLLKASLLLAVVLAAWVPPDPPPFMGDSQPLQARTLPPQITAVPVDNPPFVHRGRTAVIAQQAAAICQPDPWTYTFLGQQGRLQPYGPPHLPPSLIIVPEPPHAHPGRQAVQSQQAAIQAQPSDWPYVYLAERGRPQPYGPGSLPPSILGQSVDNPPLTQRWQSYVPTPPDLLPILAGKLSPAIPGQSVDNPPSWRAQPLPTLIPDPPPTQANKLSPGIPGQSVDTVLRQPSALPNVLAAWQSPDPPPTLTVKLVQPFVASASVPKVDDALTVIIQTWQQPDPFPTLTRKLSPSITAVSVDNPSGVASPRIVTLDPILLPQAPNKIAAVIASQVAAQTPYVRQIASIVASWQQPAPPPQQLRPLSPGIPGQSADSPPLRKPQSQSWAFTGDLSFITGPQGAPASVDNPPFGAFYSTLNIIPIWWIPPDPIPTLSNKLPSQLTAVAVNEPPFNSRQLIHWPLWQVLDPPPTLGTKLVQPGAVVVVNDPPFSSRRVPHWPNWTPPDPLPSLAGKLNPSITAVAVNNPSGVMVPCVVVVPQPLLPQQSMKVAAVLAVAPVDNPPFSSRREINWAVYQPPDPLPILSYKLSPSIIAVPVNNPPFTHSGRLQRDTILAAWQPPPPDYVSIKMVVKIVQEGPLPPPATQIEFFPFIANVGTMMRRG